MANSASQSGPQAAKRGGIRYSFFNLPPRTRIYFGMAGLAIGALGLLIDDKLEKYWENDKAPQESIDRLQTAPAAAASSTAQSTDKP